MRGRVLHWVCALLCGLVAAGITAGIAAADIGVQGPAYTAGTGGSPTTSKPESKLWYNDGFWWASMFAKTGTVGNYDIFKLVGNTWTDTGAVIDSRDSTRQDVLWDGTHLFVASHKFQSTATFSAAVGNEMKLYRFSYNSGTDTYSLDTGFPVTINAQRSEATVLDKDSTGKLWATWVQQNGSGGAYRVFVAHTAGDCAGAASGADAACVWTTLLLPGAGAVTSDDISALIAFGGNKIGVMWSDQATSAMRFAVHNDADSDATWTADNPAPASGPKLADDHINLKTAGGVVYAATKTKFLSKTALNPQTRLLVRDSGGTWTAHTISYSPDQRTRPIVVLDTGNGVIHVFETGPHPSGADPEASGGDIFESTAPLSTATFSVSSRRPVIQDDDSPGMNNATSTKQNLDSTTDLAVVATNILTKRYWHHFEALNAPPPPSGSCTITGTPGPDILNGTPGPDVLCGLGGNDIIRGFGGSDRLLGGAGSDRLYGGGGADRLFGGLGNDVLAGGLGPDNLRGSSGRDRLVGGGGRDVLLAGPGNDTLVARDRRRDWVAGGTGRDRARVDGIDSRHSIEVLF
jgi:Ca2+-binding RTX toxin-like protein